MEIVVVLVLLFVYLWLISLFFVYVFPIAAVTGATVASVWMLVNFFRAIILLCEGKLPAAVGDAPSGPEPAFKQYFFRRAFLDLRDVIATNVEFNRDALTQASGQVQVLLVGKNKESGLLWLTWPLAVVFLTVGALGVLVAVTINLTFGLLFAAGVCLCVVVNTIMMVVVRALEKMTCFPNHCPKDYHKFLLPVYECNVCHAQHKTLVPGTYGIFRRKCKCGAFLPTSYLFNRQRLESFCPNCGHRLEGEDPTLQPVLVPVIAGRSAGKTVFHVALLRRLMERQSQSQCKLSFVVPNDELEFQTALTMFSSGQVLPQTLARVPKALQLNYVLPKEFAPDSLVRRDVRLRLLMYDAAGEAYEEDQHFQQLTFVEHCTGIIMLIDPFSIPAVRDCVAQHVQCVSPSETSPDDVYSRLVEFLEQHGVRRGTQQVKIPLAVVVTKCDAFDLDAIIGVAAVRKAQEDEDHRARKEHRQRGIIDWSLLVRYWLCRWNLSNFVNNIESQFEECRYFSCSALGRIPSAKNVSAFVSRGIETPFDWILDAANIAESPTTLPQHRPSHQYQRTKV